MKKASSLFIFINLLLIFLLCLTQGAKSDSGTSYSYFVGGDGQFQDIQEAIDSANANDKIFVYSGTYNGTIKINKPITLVGENKQNTIIDSKGYENVITINSNWVNISGFTIQNGQKTEWIEEGYAYLASGILIDSDKSTIKNNIIINNTFGIKIVSGSLNNLESNLIINNGDGIWISGFNNSIVNNDISNNNQSFVWAEDKSTNTGILLNSAYGTSISYNTISDNLGNGINITLLSKNNSIYKNSFINNGINAFDDSNNSWDDGEFGNYWSDYTGKDENEDKIGDTSYLIPGGESKDNFPLMEPYEEFKINEESVQFMLILGMILAIIFLAPIAYVWYVKFLKKPKL